MNPIEWTWDERKAEANFAKHKLRFSTAIRIFDDPLAVSRPDPHPDANRIQTMGSVGSVILFVVHTWPEQISDTLIGRVISARRASSEERRAYEEGFFEFDFRR